MKACNGIKKPTVAEAMQITRLEPVIIEVEKDGKSLSHLILFEITCNVLFNHEEMIVDGDIREVIYEVKEKNYE
jgi:hypothetical protein